MFNLLVDTGSSWTWVKACDGNENSYWQTNKCPENFFDMGMSPSLDCSDEKMYIRYGSGSVSGPICKDFVKVYNTDDMRVVMPFIVSK